MIYCRCGAYLLWERDHWACMDCGASPWRCECEDRTKRIDYSPGPSGETTELKDPLTPQESFLEKAKKRILAKRDEDELPKSQ